MKIKLFKTGKTPDGAVIISLNSAVGLTGSSQHLDLGGLDGQASGLDVGVDRQVTDEVAGQAVAATRRGAVVLA
ncbi:hypothetical protein [Streptomyces sp. H27-C3]|uniref:hypothetical protein n=1 Tax=Streptomyces sp. H27-C3 TaxID=3046305 RepID=UPI0024B900CC|nr:hypothetical protein [Streptomyces sp. H27-C3]MDJ0465900.1 hypothetical protein [Streptomyces sp. H27-C3]